MAQDDAVVVGAGPNGLTGAITLAQAGLSVTVLEAEDEIGGGCRSAELTLPGVVHDICSAIHPLAAASPVFRSLPLAQHGLTWAHPPVALAHPLDDGSAAVFHRSLGETVTGLGQDGGAWKRLLALPTARYDRVAADILRPLLRVPRHLATTAVTGLTLLQPATLLARRFKSTRAKALWAGIAAHSMQPLEDVATSAPLLLAAAGHAHGWPAARGGSASIASALAGVLTSLGGRIETGTRVKSLADLPSTAVTLLDVTPRQLLDIAGDRLPRRARRWARRWRYGVASFKLDLAVEGGVPWVAEPCRRAGTVHVGGTIQEIAAAERAVHEGRVAERPFVLVAQQQVADPDRCAGDVQPLWVYCHVPHGYDGPSDVVARRIEDQIERFAPGFRDRIVARHVWTPADFERHNANNIGGDIEGGDTDAWHFVARPRLAVDPYTTGIPGVYLCSASTPPGPGVHGMCGYHAARSALRRLHAA